MTTPSRAKQDQAFWSIVQDLRWRLDDRAAGTFSQHEPEFEYGAGAGVRPQLSIPSWATHAVVFALGGIAIALVATFLR